VGHGLGHGDRVDARAGAVVNDCLAAPRRSSAMTAACGQGGQAGRVFEALGVLGVEGVGHHAATVVISKAGG